jgi:type VI secretion system protein ImpA
MLQGAKELDLSPGMKHSPQTIHSEALASDRDRCVGASESWEAIGNWMPAKTLRGEQDDATSERDEPMGEVGEEISGLLRPLASGNSAGSDGYQQISELELEVKGREEVRIVDGKEEVTAIEPSWSALKRKSASVLTKDSKHLRAAIVHAYCSLRLNHWCGLRDGLELIAGLLERYWDVLHPRLAPDGDPFERTNMLEDLSLPVNTPADPYNFVLHIQRLELTNSQRHGRWNYLAILASRKCSRSVKDTSPPTPAAEDVEKARAESEPGFVQMIAGHIDGALAALARIRAMFNGHDALPNLGLLERTLGEIQNWIAARPTAELAVEPEADHERQQSAGAQVLPRTITGSAGLPAGQVSSRAQAIELLRAVKGYYEAAEPSSPVPFLVGLAIGVSQQDFVQLLKKLPPSSIEELGRIFGDTAKDENHE